MLRSPVLATLVALTLAAPATAAPPWTPPATVSEPHTLISNPGVAVAGDGRAVAAWSWQDGRELKTATLGSAVAFRRADGTWTRQRAVPAMVAGPPVAFGRDRYVLPTQTFAPSDGAFSVVGFVAGRIGARPGRRQVIATGRNLLRTQLAGNRRGVMAYVWIERRGGTRNRLFVSLRRGGRFGRPAVLAQSRLRNVAVAVGPRGHVLVAWEDLGVVRARIAAPRGRFGRAQTIRSADPAFTRELRVAITSSGHGYVAWVSQFLDEGGDRGPILVAAAVRPSGGRFGRARRLDRIAADQEPRGLGLSTVGGEADVAWVGGAAGLQVRTAHLAHGVGAARDLPGGAGEFTVTDFVGRTILLTRYAGEERSEVMASTAFQPPEAVTPAEEAFGARGALLPGGRPLAVWVNRSVLQAADRAA